MELKKDLKNRDIKISKNEIKLLLFKEKNIAHIVKINDKEYYFTHPQYLIYGLIQKCDFLELKEKEVVNFVKKECNTIQDNKDFTTDYNELLMIVAWGKTTRNREEKKEYHQKSMDYISKQIRRIANTVNPREYAVEGSVKKILNILKQ